MKHIFLFVLCMCLSFSQHSYTNEGSELNELFTELPSNIKISIDTKESEELFNIAWNMFNRNFDREKLRSIFSLLSQNGLNDLTPEIALYLKAQRKFGTILRDAFDLFHITHQPPPGFEEFLDDFGDLNDVIAGKLHGEILKIAKNIERSHDLSKIGACIQHFEPATQESFHIYVSGLIRTLKDLSSQPQLSASKFHEMRWTTKKFLSFFDLINLKDRNPEYLKIKNFIDDLNSQMGNIHDAIVMDDLLNKQAYDTRVVIVPLRVKLGIQKLIGARTGGRDR
jgi:hypothetical protein